MCPVGLIKFIICYLIVNQGASPLLLGLVVLLWEADRQTARGNIVSLSGPGSLPTSLHTIKFIISYLMMNQVPNPLLLGLVVLLW